MPHRGEAHAAALPRIARASLPCRACLAAVSLPYRVHLAAVSPPQPTATLRTLPCHRRHARHTTAAHPACTSPPPRRVALLRCPAVLSYRSALPRRSTVARRTLRTAAARHSHRRRVLRHPTTRAASLVTRAALPPPAIPSALRLCAPPRAPRHTPRTPRAAQRRCTTSGTTARRPARIRAPTFSTARRNALPK